MAAGRGEFKSRWGFILAAAGSAVGLGNIWGFPTQAASNGGAAFVLVYLVLAFVLAYPVLMAELLIGRHAHGNAVAALRGISNSRLSAGIGALTGGIGILMACLILSFYGIVAGWILGYTASFPIEALGFTSAADWLIGFDLSRNISLMVLFMFMTIGIVVGGVHDGIERWSTRLMPALIVTLIALALYVLTLDGASAGLKVYLLPDLSRIFSGDLIFDALGSAFFSLSLGVGTMLIYGSYLSDKENLPSTGAQVALIDVGIAVLAGFLIVPAMFVAAERGVEIFDARGALLSEDTLIFNVLPALFETLGLAGTFMATAFFALLGVASLTSSISILEVPVAFLVEQFNWPRKRAALTAGALIATVSGIVLMNFDVLFGLVVTLTTRYGQPILGLMLCIYAGWVWRQDSLLGELKKTDAAAETSLFFRIWPVYVRFVCPVIVGSIVIRSIL
ncbi:sodium:neurotransmitter symporter [Luminiphilus syltensis NOR5-1B]|uniref:Sodium:neurotransmitter symporter n=1 Tax=Luminiphilus syltensis NOR5-1B TaxID=565045 RepID=B8KQQ9_9GAMM|nr:sodium-dependent transporter [Luminiphilus syltensis]EED36439.1 sodium:neurotransmitter symporter [Luminiphilus syltensis NOR5-1B]